jgi:hypothetical protein
MEELLHLIYGKDRDEEFIVLMESVVIDCFLVERLSRLHRNKLYKDYATLKVLKKKQQDYAEISEIQKGLEMSLSQGIKHFMAVFEDEFENAEQLLKPIRKLFKNYKFKKKNIVNDYSVLYFAFKTFDIYCNEMSDDILLSEKAFEIAEAAHRQLHNPYDKRRIVVSYKTLLEFISEFDYCNYEYACCWLFIGFIQAIYESDELPVYLKYDFFMRFGKQFHMVNACLYRTMNGGDTASQPIIVKEKELLEQKKINKKISNKIQNLKKSVDIKFVESIKILQSDILKFSKRVEKNGIINSKSIYKCSVQVFDDIMALKGFEHDYADEIDDIMETYKHMYVLVGDETFSIYKLLFCFCYEGGNQYIRKYVDEVDFSDNILIYQLFFAFCSKRDEELKQTEQLYEDVMGKCKDYFEETLQEESFVNEVRYYNKLIQYLDIEKAISFPILNDCDSYYDRAYLLIREILC